jgi:N-acetylglucosamine kinase-like BadF-type ATPase
MTTVVSIDWGGTSLKAVCLKSDQKPAFYTAPASNLRLIKPQQLQQIVKDLQTELQIGSSSLDYLLIGAAGAGDQIAIENLKKEIYRQIPSLKVCKIYPDYKCNHAAALGGQKGLLSINGTGSLLYYSDYSYEKRFGGWGYIFDNAPSGACFGRMALQSALESYEGNTATKLITQKLEQNHDFSDSAAILNDIYRADNQQKHLGDFAYILTSCFDKKDQQATKLINNSLEHLKKRIAFMLEAISENSLPMSGIGGLWESWPEFFKLISNMVKNNFPQIALKKPVYKNIFGPLIYQSKNCKECSHIFSLIPEKDKIYE